MLTILPLGVIVPVSTIVGVKLVYVPPLDNVKLVTFSVVRGIANAVVPKSNVLNQLPVVIVCIPEPEPVYVKLTLLVAEPPVVPKTIVFAASASNTNPPVPV